MKKDILQPLVYEIVAHFEQRRLEEQKYPFVAVETDVIKYVNDLTREALDTLVKDNVLGRTHNINHISMYSTIARQSDIENQQETSK